MAKRTVGLSAQNYIMKIEDILFKASEVPGIVYEAIDELRRFKN